MNKFIIAEMPNENELDLLQPVLYKIHIGTRYYLHKGKTLKESVDKLLDDVFRGMRGKKYPEQYSKLIEYCNKYPSVHKVVVELVFNGVPDKLLKMETKLYKEMANDDISLNRLDIEPYKPEWMIKETLQKRCTECLTHILYGEKGKPSKKLVFKFCPNCGRLNKKK